MGRPYLVFPKIGKPSTCGFDFAKIGMVEGSRLNVVDGPISWRRIQAEAQNSPRAKKIITNVVKKAPRAGGCSRGEEEGLICDGPRGSA